jgi:tRNA pseudouridine13 synthase
MIKNSLLQLKVIPSDFVVSEINFLNFYNTQGQYEYYKITKTGFTTFEAISCVSKFFDISMNSISYAGLKDEDGITEQYVSINENIPRHVLSRFNEGNFINENKFIKINTIGYSNKPMQVGEILGNNFKIVIRNLDLSFAKNIAEFKKHCFCFLNYYGSQRFGLPNSIKNTHEIGNHFIRKEYDSALTLLSRQPNEIGRKGKIVLMNGTSSEIFFKELDPKLIAFYQSSYFSYGWNERLKKLIVKSGALYQVHQENGIMYFFSAESEATNIPIFLPYDRVIPTSNGYIKQRLLRQTMVQLNLICHGFFEDVYNSKRWACEVSFFLPSGVYATTAIYQFINYLKFGYDFHAYKTEDCQMSTEL